METRDELKRKIAFCDKLGASKFQPYVLKLEKLKYKLLKDVFPSLPKRYEKVLMKKRNRALKKAQTEQERQNIVEKYRRLLIDFRKELKREQNRNYHMDDNKPTEIIKYLQWNKKVHQQGLIKDSMFIAATIAGLALGVTPIILGPILAYEVLSAFIDFQCINIQNSHIYRYKIVEAGLQKREERKNKELVQKYGEVGKVYSRCAANSIDVPTLQDIIDNVQTQEEARQLREMLLERVEKNKKTSAVDPSDKDSTINNVSSSESQPPIQTESANVASEKTFTSPEVMERIANQEIEKMMNEGTQPTKPGVQKQKGGKKQC